MDDVLDDINNYNKNRDKKVLIVSSVKWGLLTLSEVGLFQIFDHVKNY